MERDRPKLLFLVNGTAKGAMGIRAQSFAERLDADFAITTAYRDGNKVLAIFRFLSLLVRLRPHIVYILDPGFSGVLACAMYRVFSRPAIVLDTGDAIYELARLTGSRGPIGLALTKFLEKLAFAMSDRVVVRSHAYQELLQRQGIPSTVIPDGVDTAQFYPQAQPELKAKLGLEGFTVLGMMGSLIWNDRSQMCYGWDLIEAIRMLADKPVKGLIIGDGSGLSRLKARCSEWGMEDRVVFLGRIPYDDLPAYLNLMDIALSTQTNDAAGQVRTGGKLPLYLACGRFVLASDVGEAGRVLPRGMLLPYHGTKDLEYPSRLAARVGSLLETPQVFLSGNSADLARGTFDYDVLADRLRPVLHELAPETAGQFTATM